MAEETPRKSYTEHANECRRQAARSQSTEQIEMLLRMAEIWEELAKTRDYLADVEPRNTLKPQPSSKEKNDP